MNWLLWLGLIGTLVGTAATAAKLRGHDVPQARLLRIVPAAAYGTAFLFLLTRFIAVDVSYAYVHLYTSTDIPFLYRLAGAWTGREGSLLLWGLFMAIIWATSRTEQAQDERPSLWTQLVFGFLQTAFAIAILRQGLFDPVDPFFLEGRPNGNGLNPTLINAWILIHPPLMFVAYAFSTKLAAGGIGALLGSHNRWSHVLPAMRWNMAFYTVAMGMGGVWAYYTLGFGGYWAWDPVEVANFLPWLALVAAIHMALQHRRRGDYTAIGPLVMVLPFLLTLFSALSTRSGLWVSVHAFTDPTNSFNPDAAARFLTILDADPSLFLYVGLIMGILLLTLAFWHRALALQFGKLLPASKAISALLGATGLVALLLPRHFLSLWFEAGTLVQSTGLGSLILLVAAMVLAALPMLLAPETEKDKMRIGTRSLLILGALLLSLYLVVSILFHFMAVNGWNREFWDQRVPWMATPMALALMVLMTFAKRGKKPALMFAGGTLVAALIAFAVGDLGFYALVLSIGVLLAGLDKMHHVGTQGSKRARFGQWILWVQSVLLVIFWLSPPTGLGVGWPIQLMALPALAGVWSAHQVGMGAGRTWHYGLITVAGGFVGAAIAWWLREETPDKRRQKSRQVAVYGTHFMVGLLFVGYALSTYFIVIERDEVQLGENLAFGDDEIQFTDVQYELDRGRAEQILPQFETSKGTMAGILYYEPQNGAYFPLPSTIRTLGSDQYLNVESVCFENGCATVFEPAFPRAPGEPTSASIVIRELPGVSLVWASLGLSALYLGMIAKLGKST